jgi:hypothetical protein
VGARVAVAAGVAVTAGVGMAATVADAVGAGVEPDPLGPTQAMTPLASAAARMILRMVLPMHIT